MNCAICKETLPPWAYDMPPGSTDACLFALNPKTFRMASMHDYCYDVALEELKNEPAKNVNFTNRYDEYMERIK